MSAPEVLMEGIVFGESPRWHDRTVWFSDGGAHQVIAVDPGGRHEVVATVQSFPTRIDILPDGGLLVVDSARRRLRAFSALGRCAAFRTRTRPKRMGPQSGARPG